MGYIEETTKNSCDENYRCGGCCCLPLVFIQYPNFDVGWSYTLSDRIYLVSSKTKKSSNREILAGGIIRRQDGFLVGSYTTQNQRGPMRGC